MKQNLEAQKPVFPIESTQHWVGGRWLEENAGQAYISYNPSSGEEIFKFQVSNEVVDEAVKVTSQVCSGSDPMSFATRLQAVSQFKKNLNENHDLIEQKLRFEIGKPLWEAQHDISASVRYLERLESQVGLEECFQGSAVAGRVRGQVMTHPVGLVAGYISFSDPLMNFVSYVSSAILAGNPIVVISSVHSAWSVYGFVELVSSLDLPKGFVSVVMGGYKEFRRVLSYSEVRVALYTGSAEHCDELLRNTRSINDCQMIFQAGGKNSCVVHSSADIEQAVRATVYGVVKSAGQSCFSTSRVYVYRSIFPRFYEKLVEVLSKVHVGRADVDDSNSAVIMGPLCSEKALTRFLRFQTMGAREADETPLWGKRLDRGLGFLVLPGLHQMSEDREANTAYRSTVQFGPDLAIYSYDVLSDVLEQVNRYPSLSMSFIGDPEVVTKRLHQVDVPNIMINQPSCGMGVTPFVPYRAGSSLQHVHSPMDVSHMIRMKSVDHNDESLNLFQKWPEL
ncbi:MAG: aldehyde dehydrogenase [Oligoflexales bacterium]